jgi:hypothetical protein
MKPVMITRKEEALIFQKHAAGSGVWVNCPYRIINHRNSGLLIRRDELTTWQPNLIASRNARPRRSTKATIPYFLDSRPLTLKTSALTSARAFSQTDSFN